MSFIAPASPIPLTQGGTGQITKTLAENALSPMTTLGDLEYYDGTNVVRLPTGTAGQVLRTPGAGAPGWQSTGGAPYVFLGGATPVTSAGGYLPVNATPFYIVLNMGTLGGNPSTVSPTVAAYNIAESRVPQIITAIRMTIVTAGTLGSAETGTMAIRVNNTTDNAIFTSTLQWNAVQNNYSATGLSIALAAGDFFIPKITPPTWGTNPTATFYVVTVYTSPS